LAVYANLKLWKNGMATKRIRGNKIEYIIKRKALLLKPIPITYDLDQEEMADARCQGRGAVGSRDCSDRAEQRHRRAYAAVGPDPAISEQQRHSGLGHENPQHDLRAHRRDKPPEDSYHF
jgi:hypothetical protein